MGVLCDCRIPIKLKKKNLKDYYENNYDLWYKYWVVMKQYVKKMSVVEMKMLGWMNSSTKKAKIRNEIIYSKIGVTSIEKKMRKNCLRSPN